MELSSLPTAMGTKGKRIDSTGTEPSLNSPAMLIAIPLAPSALAPGFGFTIRRHTALGYHRCARPGVRSGGLVPVPILRRKWGATTLATRWTDYWVNGEGLPVDRWVHTAAVFD